MEDLYRPLDAGKLEIRLLKLQPGLQDEPLRCAFQYVELQSSVQSYETVSYVWGDKTLRGTALLHDTLIDVPKTSEATLKKFRYEDRERILWIDAVCINQEDVDERSSQVAMMADIYSGGACNLVWLGDDDVDNTQVADDSIAVILREMRRETNDLRDLTELIYTEGGAVLLSDTEFRTAGIDWPCLNRYFASPWFTRVWVVQEAALSSTSICHRGASVQPLEDVLRCAIWLLHKESMLPDIVRYPPPGLGGAQSMFAFADHTYGWDEIVYSRGGVGVLLSVLLNKIALFECRDERDKVYGILGLYKKYLRRKDLPPTLAPDYRKSTLEVFRDVCRHNIQQSRRLHDLYYVQHTPATFRQTDWPSWVPRRIHHSMNYESPLNYSDARADANRSMSEPDSQITRDANELDVRGIRLGLVTQLTSEFSHQRFEEEGAAAMRAWLDEAFALDCKLQRVSYNDHDRLAYTLTAGVDAHDMRVTATKSSELFAALRHHVYDNDSFPDSLRPLEEHDSTNSGNAANYLQALIYAYQDRCIFTTSSGHLGRGPHFVEPGDVLAILFGFVWPAVLRPVQGRDSTYRFLGRCWVYDVMEGQAVHAHEVAGHEDVMFHLC